MINSSKIVRFFEYGSVVKFFDGANFFLSPEMRFSDDEIKYQYRGGDKEPMSENAKEQVAIMRWRKKTWRWSQDLHKIWRSCSGVN